MIITPHITKYRRELTLKVKFIDFILSLQFIFKPSFWYMLSSTYYSKEWDIILNDLIYQKEEFTNITEYSAYLGDYKLWIGNYPYTCFTDYYETMIIDKKVRRPSRLTILRLRQKLPKDFV